MSKPSGAWASVRAWIAASRLASQTYIALPLFFGQLLGAHERGGALGLRVLVGVQLFGLLDQLYIVYANDVADLETDRSNRTATPFSGGSRVLVDERLSARALGRAALAAALGMLAVAIGLARAANAPALIGLAVVALVLLAAYSYPPLRLSYRGGGELLQMLGVGFVLPLFGFVAQGGDVERFPWAVLAFLLPTHLACAIATALPDEPSDRASRKQTLAVLVGGTRAVMVIVALEVLSLALVPFGLAAIGRRVGYEWSLPAMATLAICLAAPAPPGSRRLLVRVGAAITCTLAIVGCAAFALVYR